MYRCEATNMIKILYRVQGLPVVERINNLAELTKSTTLAVQIDFKIEKKSFFNFPKI